MHFEIVLQNSIFPVFVRLVWHCQLYWEPI